MSHDLSIALFVLPKYKLNDYHLISRGHFIVTSRSLQSHSMYFSRQLLPYNILRSDFVFSTDRLSGESFSLLR